jgi:hypothetical protein
MVDHIFAGKLCPGLKQQPLKQKLNYIASRCFVQVEMLCLYASGSQLLDTDVMSGDQEFRSTSGDLAFYNIS